MVGVAVKVTLVPEQMVVVDAAMLTEGVTAGVTVMVCENVAIHPNASVTCSVTTKFPDVAYV